jgi:pimeloyl-ACP methyl ester carboxylesterase
MRVTVGSLALHVVERGIGPAVLHVHDLAADHGAGEPLLAALAPRERVILYDRRGYGGSEAPEPYEGTTVNEQSEDAARLLAALAAAPALVCGEGFGALVALDLAERYPRLVRALVASRPPLFAFVPRATQELAAERELLLSQVQQHGPEGAVESWLARRPDRGAQGSQHAQDALARARAAHRAFFADFAGLTSWPVSRRSLRAFDLPLVSLTSPADPPHVIDAADALASLVPGARRRLDGDLVGAAIALL